MYPQVPKIKIFIKWKKNSKEHIKTISVPISSHVRPFMPSLECLECFSQSRGQDMAYERDGLKELSHNRPRN